MKASNVAAVCATTKLLKKRWNKLANAGSPIQPKPKEAKVIPS